MSKKDTSVRNLKKVLDRNIKISDAYLNFKIKLNKFIKKKPFTVAVSGGADSLALTAFSKLYSHEMKTKVYFVLINHGIRKGSDKEAANVKKILNKYKVKLFILKNKTTFKSNIQKKARDIRYQLISKFCKKYNIKFTLTAHHADDQIETFLIRLSRGSGIQGLSSMQNLTKINRSIKLYRPFLEFKKKDLVFITKKFFGRSINDPSNIDQKYLRTKIRKLAKTFEKSGIHHNQIIKSINNLASARDILNNYIEKVTKSCVKKNKKETLINLKILLDEENEVQLRVLGEIIKKHSKSYYPPRSKKTIRLMEKLSMNKKVKTTLGGCVLIKSGKNLLIKKET
ncbi:MAG: tRNA lysidine(34) synthetase TilS [Pelagibacteraceae bacterium]